MSTNLVLRQVNLLFVVLIVVFFISIFHKQVREFLLKTFSWYTVVHTRTLELFIFVLFRI